VRNPAAQGKPDSNHADVVGWYESLYCSVFDSHACGLGFPDLVVGIAGVTCLVEIKSEDGELRASQNLFIRTWRGAKPVVVRTQGDVINHVQSVRERVSMANPHVGRDDPA
jgi:hypothetical protein